MRFRRGTWEQGVRSNTYHYPHLNLNSSTNPMDWIIEELAKLSLGDKRLNKRARTILAQLAATQQTAFLSCS